MTATFTEAHIDGISMILEYRYVTPCKETLLHILNLCPMEWIKLVIFHKTLLTCGQVFATVIACRYCRTPATLARISKVLSRFSGEIHIV